ncbi:hypothetical protein STEG23_025965 [Scotinomys teguina]
MEKSINLASTLQGEAYVGNPWCDENMVPREPVQLYHIEKPSCALFIREDAEMLSAETGDSLSEKCQQPMRFCRTFCGKSPYLLDKATGNLKMGSHNESSELGTSYKKSLLNQASTVVMSLMRKTTSGSPIGHRHGRREVVSWDSMALPYLLHLLFLMVGSRLFSCSLALDSPSSSPCPAFLAIAKSVPFICRPTHTQLPKLLPSSFSGSRVQVCCILMLLLASAPPSAPTSPSDLVSCIPAALERYVAEDKLELLILLPPFLKL